MITIAESADMMYTIGAGLAFRVGVAAIHQLVASVKNLIRPDHYGSPLKGFVDDIVKEPIREEKGVVTISNNKPGLGVEIDEVKLRRYQCGIS